jgi:gamma-D-glutamyl-L-lysine dipeptidyl-peptidase
MTTTMTSFAVSVGVADIRRYPDAASELVTQALMNAPVTAGEITGEWTHATLSDYTGWLRSDQLEEPINKGFCKVGEHCRTPLRLIAIINKPRTALYAHAENNDTLGTLYLSTALPVVDTTVPGRVQVVLPGEHIGWLSRDDVVLREGEDIYPHPAIEAITGYARAFLGRPYLWGGTSWEGIDCSGLVQLCYRMGGYIIPRDADQQHDSLPCCIDRAAMQQGDLVFFGSQEITHVAMALSNKEYIHAEGQHYNQVVINSFDPADAHYYPRLDQIVWGIKRVAVHRE